MKDISSSKNANFKLWRSLIESRGIKKEGLCLVAGPKVQEEILRDLPELLVEWIVPPKKSAPTDDLPVYRLTGELFNELDVSGTHQPIAVVKTPSVPAWSVGEPQGLELIVSLSDPANLGALLRSAEAFGVGRVILTQECASPFLPKSLRASSGSSFRVPLAFGPSVKSLKVNGAVALDLQGEDMSEFSWPQNVHLVLGEEGQGLPETLDFKRIFIPMSESVESLNATVAASLALFSYRLRFPLGD